MLSLESKLGLNYWVVLPAQNGKPEIKLRIKFQNQGASVSPLKSVFKECDSIKVCAAVDHPTGEHTRDTFIGKHQLTQVVIVKKHAHPDQQMQTAAEALAETLTKIINKLPEDQDIPENTALRVNVEVRRATMSPQ